MTDNREFWLTIYRAICMVKAALEKLLGIDKCKGD